MTPSGRPFRVVLNIENDDKHTMEMVGRDEDGKTLTKSGTITETRAEVAAPPPRLHKSPGLA